MTAKITVSEWEQHEDCVEAFIAADFGKAVFYQTILAASNDDKPAAIELGIASIKALVQKIVAKSREEPSQIGG